jgi:ribosomal protein S18 acetylase RimI-like enzyme
MKPNAAGGVGRKLMVELLERVRALGHAALEPTVSGDNAAALDLYQSLGFVTIGEDSTGRRWMRLGFDSA